MSGSQASKQTDYLHVLGAMFAEMLVIRPQMQGERILAASYSFVYDTSAHAIRVSSARRNGNEWGAPPSSE